MSNYYTNQESVANIYVGLVKRGWECYGYKEDQSDSMTDYWSPARWEGIATKNGYVLLVDVYGTSKSGYKVTKQGYTPDYSKISKLQATINDKAASQNEKEASQKIIDSMLNKQKESNVIVEEYPTFSQGNPKGCNWHIEKNGVIIAKGKGAFQCDGYLFGNYKEETMNKVNSFIDKIEAKMAGSEQLEEVQEEVVKVVTKPVEVTDRKELKVGDVLKFEYHGHYWVVISVNEKTFTYELLGSEKRGYQRLTNGKRYYDYMTTFNRNIENGRIKLYELKEVKEVTYKTVFKSVKRQGQQENLLASEQAVTTKEEIKTEEVAQTTENSEITFQTSTGSKGNGIEITFTNKPSEEVRNAMKANGYRWGGKNRSNIWWAIMSDETLSLAKKLAGEQSQNDITVDEMANNEQNETITELNNINAIMNDISTIEDITAGQKERIQILLNHWNNKNIAVLEEIYKQGNGNIILKAEDKRKNVSSTARYARIFATGEVTLGITPKQSEMDQNNYPLIYKVNNHITEQNNSSDNVTAQNSYTYPEIDIDDNESYTISQSLQDREHDANWVMRKNKIDHNQQIHEYFTQLTDEVKQIIETTENEYYIYKLKKTLQYYKKHYFDNYIARLTNKANNPSWVTTGSAGRNRSRDNKYNNRYDKLMSEWIELDNDYKSRINSLKNKIRKDKEDALKAQLQNELSQPLPELTFKTVTKEFDLYNNGSKVKTRFYECEGYSICKVWGAFRVFEIATGKEIYSTKSAGTLQDAKAYVSLMIKQNKQIAS